LFQQYLRSAPHYPDNITLNYAERLLPNAQEKISGGTISSRFWNMDTRSSKNNPNQVKYLQY